MFKFLPAERVDVIRDLRIRFSPLGSLNDPYEELPFIDMENITATSVADIEDGMKRLWDRTPDEEKTAENKSTLEKGTAELIQTIQKMLSSKNIAHETMSLFNDTFGILSLSRSKHNLLMWSHYASSMSGYVIEFNEEDEFLHMPTSNGEKTNPKPVKYSEARQKIEVGCTEKSEMMLFHKPIDWAYEQEERVLLSAMDPFFKITNKDLFGNDIYLYPIPATAIKAVYLGLRSSEELKSTIIKSIKSNRINCTLYQAELSEKEYRLVFKVLEVNAN
jgi:hypothetical protein